LNNGLPIDEAAQILNVSKNYLYRLIREERLEMTSSNPIRVSSRSVVKRLISLRRSLNMPCRHVWIMLSVSMR
jgi:hypothetical protein